MAHPTHIALLLTFLFLSKASPSPINNLPAIKQISANVFTCDSSNELLNAICQVGLRKINAELEAAGVSIDRNGILFTWEDPKDVKVKTGHSCTVTAKVTNQKVTARINSGENTRLKFSGDSLTEPFAFRLKLPIDLTARIDVKQRFGTRILGGCSNTGSDTYAFKANLATTADAMVGLGLNPSLGMLDSGDYGLVIQPKAVVVSQVRKRAFQFSVSGVSPLTSVVTFVNGFGSTFFKSVTKIFTGESIEGVFSDLIDQLAVDVGLPILLGIGALPRPLEVVIFEKIDRIFQISEREVEKRTKGFGPDIEDKLQGDLNRIFKLGADGKRVFIIKKDIIELIRQFGVGADVFVEPPVSPAVACEARARQVCNIHNILTECAVIQQECQQLREEHDAKYTPANVIVSKPKVASLPPPTTNPPPTTKPPTTRPPFTTDCNPRPGQEVEC